MAPPIPSEIMMPLAGFLFGAGRHGLSGFAGMHWLPFTAYTFVGTALWTAALTYAGSSWAVTTMPSRTT